MGRDGILPDSTKDFQSVEDGKDEVEQHEIGLFTTNSFQSLRTIVSNGDFETLAVQQSTEELDDAVHVFDHQNLCHWISVKVVSVRLIGGGRSICMSPAVS